MFWRRNAKANTYPATPPQVDPLTSAARHAAMLRMIRNSLGMLCHPDGDRVWTQHPEAKRQARATVRALAKSAPLLWTDLLGFARAGVREIEVSEGPDGIARFCRRDP